MKKQQFLVLGTGRFGTSISKKLMELGQEVLVVDSDLERINQLSDMVTWALEADVTNEKNLKEIIGVRNFDVVILAIGTDIQSSIMTAILLKDMGVKHLIAKANNDLHAKVLYKIGVDQVIFPEREMGAHIAQSLVHENVIDYIHLSKEYSIMEVKVPRAWVKHSIIDIDVKQKFGVNIIAIKEPDGIIVDVNSERLFKPGDVLVVVGRDEAIEKLPE